MTDKEAIEILKEFKKYFEAEAIQRQYSRNISITVGEDDIEAIDTILLSYEVLCNELDKKNKEIEKLKSHNKDLLRKLRNRIKEVNKLNKYRCYKKEFKNLNKKIEELKESIHKERVLAEAQTTYEVNEMWKQKIIDKINMLEEEITSFYAEEQELGRYDTVRLEILETVEEQLLKGEDE